MMSREQRRRAFFDLVARVGAQPGHLGAAVREALVRRADGEGAVPRALAPLVEQIRSRAADVTDAHIAQAQRDGYNDDQLYELTVSTALGESARRFRRVLDLLGRRAD